MMRLLAIGCAAALLIAAAVHAQVAAPAPGAVNPASGTTYGVSGTTAQGIPATPGVPTSPSSTPVGQVGLPAPESTVSGFTYSTAAAPVASTPMTSSYPPGDVYQNTYQNTPWAYAGKPGKPADEETNKLTWSDRELSGKIQALAATYKDLTDDAKRGEAQQEIAKMVAQQFEIRQQLRQKQLAALEDQVKRLRTLHDQRNEQRDRIVADRVQQVLREATGLGWGDLEGGGNDYSVPFKMKVEAAQRTLGATQTRRAVSRNIDKGGNPSTDEAIDIKADESADDLFPKK